MEKIKRLFLEDNMCFIIGMIFLVGILFTCFWGYRISKIDIDNPKYMYYASTDDYVYVNNNDYLWPFASDDNYIYAFIPYHYTYEDDMHYEAYIGAFPKDEFDSIDAKYDTDESILKEGVSFTGIAKYIDTDLASFALEAYNKEVTDSEITKDNFSLYYGTHYILVGGNPKDYSGPIIVGIMLFIFGAYFMGRGIKSKIVTKKVIESDIYMDAINSLNNDHRDYKKLIVTDKYLMYASSGLKIIPINDLVWIYPHTVRYNGVPCYFIAYHIKGSKKKNLISLKKNDLYDALDYISSKNTDTLIGYTEENKKAYKEIV